MVTPKNPAKSDPPPSKRYIHTVAKVKARRGDPALFELGLFLFSLLSLLKARIEILTEGRYITDFVASANLRNSPSFLLTVVKTRLFSMGNIIDSRALHLSAGGVLSYLAAFAATNCS